MDVDTAGQDQKTARVDDLTSGAREPGEIGRDRLDGAAADRDVGPARPGHSDHGPAPHDQIRPHALDGCVHPARIAIRAGRPGDAEPLFDLAPGESNDRRGRALGPIRASVTAFVR